jgi:hypothetical protein
VRVIGEVFDVLLSKRFVRSDGDCYLAGSGTLGCLNNRLRNCLGGRGFDGGLRLREDRCRLLDFLNGLLFGCWDFRRGNGLFNRS